MNFNFLILAIPWNFSIRNTRWQQIFDSFSNWTISEWVSEETKKLSVIINLSSQEIIKPVSCFIKFNEKTEFFLLEGETNNGLKIVINNKNIHQKFYHFPFLFENLKKLVFYNYHRLKIERIEKIDELFYFIVFNIYEKDEKIYFYEENNSKKTNNRSKKVHCPFSELSFNIIFACSDFKQFNFDEILKELEFPIALEKEDFGEFILGNGEQVEFFYLESILVGKRFIISSFYSNLITEKTLFFNQLFLNLLVSSQEKRKEDDRDKKKYENFFSGIRRCFIEEIDSQNSLFWELIATNEVCPLFPQNFSSLNLQEITFSYSFYLFSSFFLFFVFFLIFVILFFFEVLNLSFRRERFFRRLLLSGYKFLNKCCFFVI